jgi:hypothetical protein
MRRPWLLLVAAVRFGVAIAAPQGTTEIQYDVSCSGILLAEIVEKFEISGTSYRMTETTKGKGIYAQLGSMKRTSRGSIVDGVLRPVEYADERTGRDATRAWFDWQAQTVTMQHQGKKGSEYMPPNAQDRLSFMLAVTLMPKHNRHMKFSIFDGRGQSRDEYDVGGSERIKTPLGEFNTVKVVKRDEQGTKDQADTWLATELDYLPVRVVTVEKGGIRCEDVAVRISRQ